MEAVVRDRKQKQLEDKVKYNWIDSDDDEAHAPGKVSFLSQHR